MTHIDVQSALAESLSMPYHDLVTRRTGAAVRTFIEHQLSGLADGSVAFLDFSRIGVLDRSCADEFVAKLMLPLTVEHPSRDGYVVLHGLSDGHLDSIEQVLHAHGLALVVQFPDGIAHLVGAVTEVERRLWQIVMVSGRVAVDGLAVDGLAAQTGLAIDEALALLDSLARRRLVRREHDCYCPLGTAA